MKKLSFGEVLTIAIIICVLIYIFRPVYPSGRPITRKNRCMSNVKQWQLALIAYAADNDETWPDRDGWMDAAQPNINKNPRLLICPELKEMNLPGIGYAFNSLLDRKKTGAVAKPAETFLIYDSLNLARNASDPLLSLPNPARHYINNVIGYADGHVHSKPPPANQSSHPQTKLDTP